MKNMKYYIGAGLVFLGMTFGGCKSEVSNLEVNKTNYKYDLIGETNKGLAKLDSLDKVIDEAGFMAAARKNGVTGIYAFLYDKQLNEISFTDYSVGGPIYNLANFANLGETKAFDLLDESNEPEQFNKNGINDFLTKDQAKRIYRFKKPVIFFEY